jgi:nucleoside-diphosphate-sugar epimerase
LPRAGCSFSCGAVGLRFGPDGYPRIEAALFPLAATGARLRHKSAWTTGLRENPEEIWRDVELVEGDAKRSPTDVAAARRLLGYKPEVSFEEGLRRTIDWYRWALETGYGGWAAR